MKSLARQFAVVFGLWTLIGLASGAADYGVQVLMGDAPRAADVFRGPLTEQWIWAALTPIVFYLAGRVPLAPPRLLRALVLHIGFFVVLAMLHCLVAEALSAALADPLSPLPPRYHGSRLALRFFSEFYSDIWMYWPLVGIRALIDAHTREREREHQANRLEQLMADLKLSLLRAQIQPHFLFNTLHAISALLRVDPRAAEDMVADLAEILRASFADSASQETPLQRELDLVGCYLRIQQRRLGERLTVCMHIEPDTLEAAVPALVLQSLVENAVVHGIAPLARLGTLTLSARRDGGQLRLTVADDGAGMAVNHRFGVGLANARERLAQLYGADQSFELGSEPDRGLRVALAIPYRRFITDTASGRPVARGFIDAEDPDTDRGRRAAGAVEPVVAA